MCNFVINIPHEKVDKNGQIPTLAGGWDGGQRYWSEVLVVLVYAYIPDRGPCSDSAAAHVLVLNPPSYPTPIYSSCLF